MIALTRIEIVDSGASRYRRQLEGIAILTEHSSRVAPAIFRKIGRPIGGGPNTFAARDQPTYATRSWAFASAAVAGCAGSWSTVAS